MYLLITSAKLSKVSGFCVLLPLGPNVLVASSEMFWVMVKKYDSRNIVQSLTSSFVVNSSRSSLSHTDSSMALPSSTCSMSSTFRLAAIRSRRKPPFVCGSFDDLSAIAFFDVDLAGTFVRSIAGIVEGGGADWLGFGCVAGRT